MVNWECGVLSGAVFVLSGEIFAPICHSEQNLYHSEHYTLKCLRIVLRGYIIASARQNCLALQGKHTSVL